MAIAMLALTSCGLHIQPPSYEAATAEGNFCRNQCAQQYLACTQLMAAHDNSTEVCSRGMKSGLDLEHCYQQCQRFHGGEFTPYQEEWASGSTDTSGCIDDNDCSRRLQCVDGRCTR